MLGTGVEWSGRAARQRERCPKGLATLSCHSRSERRQNLASTLHTVAAAGGGRPAHAVTRQSRPPVLSGGAVRGVGGGRAGSGNTFSPPTRVAHASSLL